MERVEPAERVRILRSTTASLLRDRDRLTERLAAVHGSSQRRLLAEYAEVNRELGRRDAGEERS